MKPEGITSKDWIYYNILFVLEHFLGYNAFEKYFGKNRRALYKKIDNLLQSSGRGNVSEVEEVDNDISYDDFLKKCYRPVMPKVFRGVAKEWNAVKNWNFDFFAENHGHKEIILTDNVGLSDQEFEHLTLKYYVDQMKDGSLKYLRFSDIVNDDPNLKSDFDINWLRKYKLPFSWGEDLKMFMGGKNTLTTTHVGFSSFLFVQVMGKKKWILYQPNERIFLDPRTERTFHFYSKASPYKKDDTDFPLLKYAKQYEVILEPGDVLWVPSFVWHHVENLTDSIGIRYGHSSIPGSWKSSKILTTLIFLATNPNMISHFYIARTKKRELQFIKKSNINN
jgi:hypothetical protein